MKKLTTIILAIALLASFSACCAKNEETLPTEEQVTEIVTEEVTDVIEKNTEEDKEEVKEEHKEENKEEVKEEAEEKEETNLTLGNTLLSVFKEEANKGTSMEEIANKITTLPELTFAPVTAPVEPGYLPGFSEEITNFTSGVTFAPMIGSIPFVGYILEAEDADALIATLKANADLRWNICVEAEEMVTGKVGNKVFFVMCPKSLEE